MDQNAIKFHCYSSHSAALIDLLGQAGYDFPVEVYNNPVAMRGMTMTNLEKTVQIGSVTYRGMLSDDSKSITIFESSSDDDIEIIGRYEIDSEGNLIEFFPLTERKQIIGKILNRNENHNERAVATR